MFICRNDFGARFEALPHETQVIFFQMARYIHGGGSWGGGEETPGEHMKRLYNIQEPSSVIDQRIQDIAKCNLIKLGKNNTVTLYCGEIDGESYYSYSPIERLNNDYNHLMPALEAVAKQFVAKEIEQGRRALPWFRRKLGPADFRGGA